MPLLDLNEPAQRRRLLFGFLALAGVVLVWVLFSTVSGNGGNSSAEWSYTQLVQEAGRKAPAIKELDISGQSGAVTDPQGHQHQVRLPPDTSALADELANKNVAVYYHGDSGFPAWLSVLLMVAVLAALGAAVYAFFFRKTRGRY